MENILSMVSNEIREEVNYWPENEVENETQMDSIIRRISTILPASHKFSSEELMVLDVSGIEDRLLQSIPLLYEERENELGLESMRSIERLITLRTIDNHWVRHLTTMENLRQGVGLLAYGQRDPLIAYRTQGHQEFQQVMDNIQHDIAHTIFHVTVAPREPSPEITKGKPIYGRTDNRAAVINTTKGLSSRPGNSFGNTNLKIGRNDPCPCGSGKKFKRCHG